MKKVIYLLTLTVLTFSVYSFTVKNVNYPAYLPSEYVEVLKKDFIKTVDNESLISVVERNFAPLFDEVDRIDAQFSDKSGYYYMVMGKKEGKEKFEILKVNKTDIDNETYTYIDFTNLDAMSNTYCSSGPASSPFPFVCTGPCQERTSPCLGAICGILIGGQCVQQ